MFFKKKITQFDCNVEFWIGFCIGKDDELKFLWYPKVCSLVKKKIVYQFLDVTDVGYKDVVI